MSSPQQQPDPQAAQAGLAVVLAAALARLWPSLDLANLRQGLPGFTAAVAVEVRRHAQASATLATRQYRAQRAAAGVRGAFTPVPADPPALEQIAATVDWATRPLWNPNVLAHATAGGHTANVPTGPGPLTDAPPAGSAIADAKARLAAASERQVLDAGRNTIVDNAGRDRQAKGWARVPEPGACSFCLLLAIRGAVYTSQQTAGPNQRSARHKTRAGEAFLDGGDFKTHDHCRCTAVPVFTAYEPSAQLRQAQGLYKKVVTDQGRTGADARAAFRQAVEGREVTGSTGDTKTTGAGSSRKAPLTAQRTPEQIHGELTALEKYRAAKWDGWNDTQRESVTSRMALLRQQLGQ